MDKPLKFLPVTGHAAKIAYVRPVTVGELPDELREQAEGVAELYAVHDEDGERLALVSGKKLAFFLARQNDLAPVHVH